MIGRRMNISEGRMSPALMEVQPIECYKHGYVIETHNRITFNFYTQLPHNYVKSEVHK